MCIRDSPIRRETVIPIMSKVQYGIIPLMDHPCNHQVTRRHGPLDHRVPIWGAHINHIKYNKGPCSLPPTQVRVIYHEDRVKAPSQRYYDNKLIHYEHTTILGTPNLNHSKYCLTYPWPWINGWAMCRSHGSPVLSTQPRHGEPWHGSHGLHVIWIDLSQNVDC